MYQLDRIDFERVRPLFRKMDHHLPLQAILAGGVNAPIFVDNTKQPQVAITWVGHRFFVLGSPGNTELIAPARKIFLEKFSMAAWNSGYDSYTLYYPSEKWEVFIKAMLQNKYPISAQRSYLINSANRQIQSNLPDGYSLHLIDREFLLGGWQNIDLIQDEMSSERISVQEFLEKSFGLCLIKGKTIIAWCLSEFNTGHRCELGISVLEEFRQKGFATVLATEFLDLAHSKDIARIGWHCAVTNLASINTALRAGFEKVDDYPVFMGWFDDALNLARNGYFAHGRGEYGEALVFYEKSLMLGEVPDWVYWGAACDAALIGETKKSFGYLENAVEHGYDDRDQIEGSQYLLNLHEEEGWKLLLERLS